jgi:hypothetical protein
MNPTLQLKILTLEALGRACSSAAAVLTEENRASLSDMITARCEDLVTYVKEIEDETSTPAAG